MRFLRLLLIVLCLVSVTACGGSKEETIDYNETPVEELYNEAQQLLSEGQYRFAAQAFNEVEKQHPYSEWATRAQLMAAYSYYEASYYDEAIASLERFISLHPGHKDIAYAYYLKGLSYYEQITDIGRDQSVTENALESLRDVAERYPETVYARDSLLKIDLTRDHLAGKDMEIGRYYMTQKHYLAALNRFKTVVKDYQTTTHVPEALHRMVECYLGLGMLREAKATGAVLGHNYPGTEWYEDTYALLVGQNLEPEASQDSWISKVWNSVL